MLRSQHRSKCSLHAPIPVREDYSRWLGIGAAPLMLAGDVPSARKAELSQSVRLLPAFGQYVVAACLHAAHVLPGDFKKSIYRPQGWISPVLLVNGRMDGVWSHSKKGKRIEMRIEPFVKLPAWARRAAEEEAERLAEFLGRPLELSWK